MPPLGAARRARYQALTPVTYTLQHDMESILYVVLYCALLWCPHNAPGHLLRNILSGMFDVFEITHDGHPRGGGGKLQNMRHRMWTDDLEWTSNGMQTWLTEVMDLHHPVRADPANHLSLEMSQTEISPMWTPDALDRLWQNVLQTHKATLSYKDRLNHLQRFHHIFNTQIPDSARSRPNPATHTSPGGPKHRIAWSDDEDAPPSKHMRLYSPELEVQDGQSTTSEISVPPPSTYGSSTARSTVSYPEVEATVASAEALGRDSSIGNCSDGTATTPGAKRYGSDEVGEGGLHAESTSGRDSESCGGEPSRL